MDTNNLNTIDTTEEYLIIFHAFGEIAYFSPNFGSSWSEYLNSSFFECFTISGSQSKNSPPLHTPINIKEKKTGQCFRGTFSEFGKEILFKGEKTQINDQQENENYFFKNYGDSEEYWGQNILSVSKFPSENPNPVFRLSLNGDLLYGNKSCLKELCLISKTEIHLHPDINNLHHKVISKNSLANEQELLIGDKQFLFQWAIIEEEEYVNYYVKDVTDIFIVTQQSEIKFERTLALLKNLNGTVIIENEKKEIILWNEKAFKTFDISRHLLNQNLNPKKEDIFSTVDLQTFFFAPTEKDQYCKKEISTTDGKIYKREYIPIHINKSYVGALWLFHNITKKKLAEKELIKAKNLAQQSLSFKSNFLSNMSHEIRTPMNGIIGMTELLNKLELDKDVAEYINHIATCSKNLLHIINDILDLSKIESGKLKLESILFDLDKICQEAHTTVAYILHDKNLNFEYKIHPQLLKFNYLGDPTRLNQILINLLSNAFKFTKEGEIKLAVDFEEISESQFLIKIRVQDTGIGISAKHQKRIFQTFEQAQKGTTRKYGGTGLGLSICKMLCELQGGSITVDSKIDKGSVFTVKIPYVIKKVPQSVKKKEDVPIDYERFRNKKVLIVDDAPINRIYAQKILEGIGCKAETADNGLNAFEKLQKESFDIIFMDIQMPKMDGYQATYKIRHELNLSTPIIALTANAMQGEKNNCLEKGMVGYLSKPFYEKDIYHMMCKHLNK